MQKEDGTMYHTSSIIYVASPYYDSDCELMQKRKDLVESYLVSIIKNAKSDISDLAPIDQLSVQTMRNSFLYSPIVHWHDIANKHDLEKDVDFWWGYNFPVLKMADEILLIKLDGWDQSKGVEREINYFNHKITSKSKIVRTLDLKSGEYNSFPIGNFYGALKFPEDFMLSLR